MDKSVVSPGSVVGVVVEEREGIEKDEPPLKHSKMKNSSKLTFGKIVQLPLAVSSRRRQIESFEVSTTDGLLLEHCSHMTTKVEESDTSSTPPNKTKCRLRDAILTFPAMDGIVVVDVIPFALEPRDPGLAPGFQNGSSLESCARMLDACQLKLVVERGSPSCLAIRPSLDRS